MSRWSRRLSWQRLPDAALFAWAVLLFSSVTAGAATISGRVTERTGLRIDGPVTITVTHLGTGAQSAVAGQSDGSFTIADFPEGDAILVVTVGERDSDPVQSRMIHVTPEGLPDLLLTAESPHGAPSFNFLLYKGEYYDNKATLALANDVSVTAALTTPNINFSLAPGGGTISGRVTNSDGSTGLPGLLVYAIGNSSEVLSFDRTDATGHYQITGIPADSFWVAVNLFLLSEASDYIGEVYNDKTLFELPDLVDVNEGADTPGIDFRLALGGTLSGRITADNGGAGIPGAEVSLELPPPGLAFAPGALTDENGNYTIRGISPSNDYRVRAEAEGFVTEYYLDQPTLGSSTPVPIVSGQTTTRDMALATGASIAGTVLRDGTLEPLADFVVVVENMITLNSYYTSTDPSGHYEVGSLPGGNFRVSVPEIGKWWNNKSDPDSFDVVHVLAAQQVTGINFTGTPQGSGCELDPQTASHIRGTVTKAADAAPVEGARVELWVGIPGFRFQIGSTETDAAGNYAFECLDSGLYYVRARKAFTNLLPEWFADTDSANADQVSIPEGGGRDDVDFALSAGGAISGQVTIEGTSTALSSVTVRAVNVATGRQYEAASDASGLYTISSGSDGGLSSGTYKVWALSTSTADLSLVPVILSRFEAFDVPEGIAIEWGIEGDEAISGVHVYRSDDPAVEPFRLTENLLPTGTERFVDTSALPGVDQSYWIGIIDREGREERFGPVSARRGEAPILTQLFGPRPNPVRQSAEIAFTLARPGRVTVRIHDLAGRLVRTLIDAERPAGPSTVRWDARRDDGSPVPRGMYYVRFAAGNVVETEKLVLLR
jgi:hypothetical protein